MIQTPQIEPITNMQRDHKAVLAKLKTGPVFLAQRSKPAAVLVSVEQWDAMVKQLKRMEAIEEARKIRARIEQDPSSVVSHAELKQKLAERKAHVGAGI